MYVYDESLLKKQKKKLFELEARKQILEKEIELEKAKYTQLKKLIKGNAF